MTPLLLTPGPLTTAPSVREAMLVDYGSRDPAFVALVQRVLASLVALAPDPEAFTAVPVQGSGTFAVEAMLGTLVSVDGGVLVLDHGVYGARAAEILRRMGRTVDVLAAPEGDDPDLDALDRRLAIRTDLTHVFTVHSETTTGQLLPVAAIAEVVARHGRRLLVDAMSSLGAVPLTGEGPLTGAAGSLLATLDAVASSANKCLEGVPGLAFVLVRSEVLAAARGRCPSVSLDLQAQAERLAKDGQFRFTPPTHVLAALDEALRIHAAEGGVAGRGARYRTNMDRLVAGMRRLGYRLLLPDERQGPIIATVHLPDAPGWTFAAFYEHLRARGFAIYPGSLARTPSFRVGCIGRVFPADIDRFQDAAASWDRSPLAGHPTGATS